MASLQAWHELRFTHEGLQDVRRHFGIAPATYNQFSKRFGAAELAWFVGGTSEDGQHSQLSGGFHPLFSELHGHTFDKEMQNALMRLLFDVATVLDRAYGAGTMILHIKGTMHPNAPIRPEYMKTSVYIPPVIVNKIPIWEQPRIINIAQEFLQVIGMRTVRNFQDAVRQRDWKYSQFGAQPRANRPLYKLPRPIGSVQYIIPGHAVVHQIAASGDTSHSHDLSASGSTSHSHDLSASYDASPSHDSSALAERENDQL
ncbi:hypothetical protein AX14_000596 [Amanita brunnescens Koide BX004]|nr:hypothetical protein AX14_000596 [Amanita brunnescens Koide BX004]